MWRLICFNKKKNNKIELIWYDFFPLHNNIPECGWYCNYVISHNALQQQDLQSKSPNVKFCEGWFVSITTSTARIQLIWYEFSFAQQHPRIAVDTAKSMRVSYYCKLLKWYTQLWTGGTDTLLFLFTLCTLGMGNKFKELIFIFHFHFPGRSLSTKFMCSWI